MNGLVHPSSPIVSRPRVAVAAGLLFALVSACEGLIGSGQPPERHAPAAAVGGSGGSGGSGPTLIDVDGSTPDPVMGTGCDGLACQQAGCTSGLCVQAPCAAGTSTTVTGTVYEPAGKLPLYNVMVYVPNGPLSPLVSGPECDTCELGTERPVASALTDTHGKFVLNDVPVGADIPLVIQVGKWRRQVHIPVTACVENPILDKNLTRLPKNQSEGDIPLIAITTGAADTLECLPRRLGIEDAEFTTAGGSGRIHLYEGGSYLTAGSARATKAFASQLNDGMEMASAEDLWASLDSLSKYDILLLSCEGDPNDDKKSMTSREAMYEYASSGGRVLASHLHHFWFSSGPEMVSQVASWEERELPEEDPVSASINMTFPKGQALAEWLVNVGASATPGHMDIHAARDSVQAANPAYATEWMSIQNSLFPDDPTAVQYFSFNAPLDVPAEQQCGRAIYSDLHVSSTGSDKPGTRFPDGCEERDLSAQEKAVAFMLFDLSACVIPDSRPPEAPPVR
jgi:hypothetical protein